MHISYKKLFKLLIDKDMQKKDLCKLADISPSTLTKLKNGETINTNIILKICLALDCQLEDIMSLDNQFTL